MNKQSFSSKKKIIKRIIIITVLVNVVIFLVISARITYQKSKEAIGKKFSEQSQNFGKFPGGGSSLFGSGKPACFSASDYHAQLIYAHPKDVPSRYQELAPKLREWLKSADGILNEEAKKFNMSANLKVFCEAGEIVVQNVALPNNSILYNTAADTNQAVIGDLAKLGFQDKRTKYIVWFDGDGNPSGCGGSTCISQASKKGPDDRLLEDNVYNSGPDYALLFKIEDDKVAQFGTTRDMFVPISILHEYAHTMGAVQPSAPHSTKKEMNKVHCTDSQTIGRGGTDIMCKSDAQGEVFGNACPGMYPFHFDCNNDDYFNPKPEPGSYLATHWNLGSPLNRFIKFGQ